MQNFSLRKFILKSLSTAFLFQGLLFAQKPTLQTALEHQIIVNNNIVATVNGKNISMLDVTKKLDYMIYQSHPEIISSEAAKYQFYLSSWKFALIDMINSELMLAEAKSKDVKVEDTEIKEILQQRFGPDVTLTLAQLNLTYEEAFEIIKNEEITKRIRWFFVNTKALQKVTPAMIRTEYNRTVADQPAGDVFHFQIATIKTNNKAQSSTLALKAHQLLKNKNRSLNELKKELDNNVQISPEYTTASSELSDTYRNALASLKIGECSSPVSQISQYDGKIAWRIFYLKDKTHINPPSFDQMSEKIKNDLLQEIAKEENAKYFEKLYKKYGIDEASLHKILSDESLSPFFLR